MNSMGLCIDSLYQKSLYQLCNSMNEHTLKNILERYPGPIIMEVIWKILHINSGSNEFLYNHKSPNGELYSVNRGSIIARLLYPDVVSYSPKTLSFRSIDPNTFEALSNSQQTNFFDRFDFCNHFNLNLFFKLEEFTEFRHQLYTIFQVCIQVKGFEFPKQLVKEWINSTILEIENKTNKHFENIEQGLKLGIFLGDSGWLNESSIVLTHTYEIISTKWVCLDENLKLFKLIHCLTKWLLAALNYYDCDKAKVILPRLLNAINMIEKNEGRTMCLTDAYLVVSQYYYAMMQFNEAWLWVVKAVNELREESTENLKLSVISHTIKVCSDLNKLSKAKKLVNLMNSFSEPFDENTHINMLMSEGYYSLVAQLNKENDYSYYIALDSRRNLFGYFNFNTAKTFIDHAYARYVSDLSLTTNLTSFNEAMSSILQGIYIMKKIGVPDDNILFVFAGGIKALILEEKSKDLMKYLDTIPGGRVYPFESLSQDILKEAESLHFKTLNVSLKKFGEKSNLAALSFCNLGRLYQNQGRYTESEKMYLKGIEVKESLFGKDSPKVAISLNQLAILYAYYLKKYKEAEQLYLRSITIIETIYGINYAGLVNVYKGLIKVYHDVNDIVKMNQIKDKWSAFTETPTILEYTSTDINCINDGFSLKKLKCIVNERV